ncbi:hypothetical protein ColTof4_01128 [Colletotrichum tofieldiae]|nr:hypothetical protein ColTof3_08353 [Colletotrichum tofieldiae]GKT68705.1 hypothetical protein ColTof4_01128 [Colletotrichum tofieldiae]
MNSRHSSLQEIPASQSLRKTEKGDVFQKRLARPPDPAGEFKRRFLGHWGSRVAAEDGHTQATGLIPQLEDRQSRLGRSQTQLTHAVSAALKDVSRCKLKKRWASKVASLTGDIDDQDSGAEDITIHEATAALCRAPPIFGIQESVEDATRDVNTAVERAKKCEMELRKVCSTAEKVKAAKTAIEKCKKQQELLQAAVIAVGLLDPED